MHSPSREEIATRVEETLLDAAYLEFRGSVVQSVISGRSDNVIGGLEPVEFHSRMARDRLYCEVWRGGQLNIAFAWLNGRVQEHRPQQRDEPLIDYESSRTDGLEDTRLKDTRPNECIDCLIGTQMRTWVGPHACMGGRFNRLIGSGERQPDQEVHGHQCSVFQHARTTCAEEPLIHTIYVQQETFLVVRWQTLHQGVFRERSYDPIAFGDTVPEDASWVVTSASARAAARRPTDDANERG